MPATPILDDLDMNYSEILKGRLENISSFPTGLDLTHKGYSVYSNSKLWIWDGLQWCTWDSMPWTYEDNDAVDHLNPRTESTAFNGTSHYLSTLGWNANLAEGYDDNIPRTLGAMHFIGSDQTISDWQTIKGRRFVYTAKDGSWFNIKNNSPNQIPANHKRIDTRTDTDLTEIVKAEFSYSNTGETWILVSYEKRQVNWFKRYPIPATPILGQSQFSGNVPLLSNEGLPYDGFYEVHAYVEVKEYEADRVTLAATYAVQTLELMTPGDNWTVVDKSGLITQVATHLDIKWFNFSLQGSVILYAQSADCGSRDVNYRVTLPNGLFRQLLGGYIHVKYLGTTEGNNCTGLK